MLLLGARWDPLGQTGKVCGAELELEQGPVPSQGSLQDVLCSCRTCARCGGEAGAIQGTPFLGNSSGGERFLPKVNVRAPFLHWICVSLCFWLSQIQPWLCGSVAGSHWWIPGWISGLELEKKKGFGWPAVGLRLLWLHPLWTSPCWVLVAVGCQPKAQGRPWKCFLWFLWPLAADPGDFNPPGHGCSLGLLQGLQEGLQEAAPEAYSALECEHSFGVVLVLVYPRKSQLLLLSLWS